MLKTLNFNLDKESGLQLNRIEIDEEYAKKWNSALRDFFVLSVGEKLLRPVLYRKGGIGDANLNIDSTYFMLLKYVESEYSDYIMKTCGKHAPKNKRHLAGHWCILNKNGDEIRCFKQFETPHIIKNSLIYSLNSKYYNIETNECYGDTHNSITSENFLFLKNHDKNCVLKINLKNGTYEEFK